MPGILSRRGMPGLGGGALTLGVPISGRVIPLPGDPRSECAGVGELSHPGQRVPVLGNASPGPWGLFLRECPRGTGAEPPLSVPQLLQLCQRVLGQTLFERLMKMTFYGQFVAGEDQEAIKPLLRRNQAFGVGAVLDYSVEEDLGDGR